jgi:hypothetical protein
MSGHFPIDELRNRVASIRGALEPAFASDTALDQMSGPVPSAGHCAAVAVLVNDLLGGTLVSAIVNGQSHWFNRVQAGNGVVDVDVTGDQFGLESIRIGAAGTLYEDTRVRTHEEVHEETFVRATKLGTRAGLERTQIVR